MFYPVKRTKHWKQVVDINMLMPVEICNDKYNVIEKFTVSQLKRVAGLHKKRVRATEENTAKKATKAALKT